jgi:hypothetical protein
LWRVRVTIVAVKSEQYVHFLFLLAFDAVSKRSMSAWESNNVFRRDAKYFVLLLTIMSFKYITFVCILTLVIRHANYIFSATNYTVVCGWRVCLSAASHLISGSILGKKFFLPQNVCFGFLYNF